MEIYKRTVGYEDISRTNNLVVTGTTLYFPFYLKQSYEDIGIYTDLENPVFEIVDLSGVWNFTNPSTEGSRLGTQTPCKILNNCKVSFTSKPVTFFDGNDGYITTTLQNKSECINPSYEWEGPNNFRKIGKNIYNIKAGTYTLKITDDNCDMTYVTYVVDQPQQTLTLNLNTVNSQVNDLNGTCNGSASVYTTGGVPPYTYEWFSGPPNLTPITGTTSGQTNLCAGVYTVRITDSNNSVISSIFNITEPITLSGSVKYTTNLTCNSNDNGEIYVQGINGYAPTGYTYNLEGPSPSTSVIATNTTGNFIGLSAGTYTVEVVDNVGSTYNITNITLTNPYAITMALSGTNLTCYNSFDGTITALTNIQNGNALLVGNSTSISQPIVNTNSIVFTGLSADDYSLTITSTNIDSTDSSICNTTDTISLYQKPGLSLNVITSSCDLVVTAQTTYSLSGVNLLPPPTLPMNMSYYVNGIYISGCTLPSPSQYCQSVLPLNVGTNDITVVDTNNCSATTVVNISNSPLSMTYGIIDVEDNASNYVSTIPSANCLPGQTKQFIIDINGGKAPYTIAWSGDNDTSTITTSKAHCTKVSTGPGSTYQLSVTVTDANNCSVTKTWSIDTSSGNITEL